MMFDKVALSQIARPVFRHISVMPGTSYRTIGVKWWGEGAYERETIDGSQTAAKTLSIVRENDLIINKIWVRHGSTAVASKAVDGCTASGEFPTFELNRTQILPRWMHWLTKSREFWKQCDTLSRGTSGKNRIRPELFLTIRIPLPSLEEQRRIVARIEELAGKIEEARGLRQEVGEEAEILLSSTLTLLFEGYEAKKWLYKRLTEDNLAMVVAGQHIMAEEYNEVGDGFPYITGPADFGPRVPEIRRWTLDPKVIAKPGDVLLTVKGAGVGKINFAPQVEVAIGRQLMAIRPNHDCLLSRFLYYFLEYKFRYFQSIATATTVPGFKKTDVEGLSIPLPSLQKQEGIVTYLDNLQNQVDIFEHMQFEVSAELDALLPSILDKAFRGEL